MFGYEKPYDYRTEMIRTWDVLQYGPGAPVCGKCHSEVAAITMDKQTVLACTRCNVSARMQTTDLNNYLSTHRRVTFPVAPWRY